MAVQLILGRKPDDSAKAFAHLFHSDRQEWELGATLIKLEEKLNDNSTHQRLAASRLESIKQWDDIDRIQRSLRSDLEGLKSNLPSTVQDATTLMQAVQEQAYKRVKAVDFKTAAVRSISTLDHCSSQINVVTATLQTSLGQASRDVFDTLFLQNISVYRASEMTYQERISELETDLSTAVRDLSRLKACYKDMGPHLQSAFGNALFQVTQDVTAKVTDTVTERVTSQVTSDVQGRLKHQFDAAAKREEAAHNTIISENEVRRIRARISTEAVLKGLAWSLKRRGQHQKAMRKDRLADQACRHDDEVRKAYKKGLQDGCACLKTLCNVILACISDAESDYREHASDKIDGFTTMVEQRDHQITELKELLEGYGSQVADRDQEVDEQVKETGKLTSELTAANSRLTVIGQDESLNEKRIAEQDRELVNKDEELAELKRTLEEKDDELQQRTKGGRLEI